MKEITVKNLVNFRSKKSDGPKTTFAQNLKKAPISKEEEETEEASGGNYWVTSLSALGNSFRDNRPQIVVDKVADLEGRRNAATSEKTKNMHLRNIEVLDGYKTTKFWSWFPGDLRFLTISKEHRILDVKGLKIKALPKFVFEIGKKGSKQMGAILFVAQKGGFTEADLGMFADMLQRYLQLQYNNTHDVLWNHCLVVDVHNNNRVSCAQIMSGEVVSILEDTVEELLKFL